MKTSPRRKGTRTAFAATLALGLLLVLSVFGGVGFAKNPGAAQKQYGKKVTICHKGKTLSVSKNAVKAHVKHGDTVGACASDARKGKAVSETKSKGQGAENKAKGQGSESKSKGQAEDKSKGQGAEDKSKGQGSENKPAETTPNGKGHGKK